MHAAVHFRNVRVGQPRLRFVEEFVDGGEADMRGCMAALIAHEYGGGIDPDHTPTLLHDTADTALGWTLALGYIAALRDVCVQDHKNEWQPQRAVVRGAKL